MWGGQLWFSSMMREEQKSEETHSAFVERCQSTALKVLKWGPKGNFAHNRREENTEYVCIGSWEERIVLYVLYLVPCMYLGIAFFPVFNFPWETGKIM